MELRHKDFDQAKYDAVKQVYAEFQRELYLSVWGIGKVEPIKGQTVFDLQAKERREQEVKGA